MGAGIFGAVLKLVKPEPWWHVVQFTAPVFVVLKFDPSCCKYRTGWMLLLVLRWHWVQFNALAEELLCCSKLFMVADPPGPWQARQKLLLGNVRLGLVSVLL